MCKSSGLKSFLILVVCFFFTHANAFQPEAPLPWGRTISSAAECPDQETFAFIQGGGFTECLRYFSSGLTKKNPLVIVVMEGDRDNDVNKPVSNIANNTPASRLKYASQLQARANVPVILLSRPGVYGSTGDHRHKRTMTEFAPIFQALDVLGQRYGVGRWIVVGHSGGGTAAAALLTMGRTDLECVVVTSGAFDLVERANRYRQRKGLQPKPFTDLTGTVHPYDPLYRLDGVQVDKNRKIFLLGNPQDKVTPFEFQEKFVEGLIKLGHHAQILEAEAQPPNFHDLAFGSGLKAAKACVGLQ